MSTNTQDTKSVFKVPVTFTYEGFFFVRADNEDQAIQFVAESCGMVANNGYHSSLPEADVDWYFETHPQKTIDFEGIVDTEKIDNGNT